MIKSQSDLMFGIFHSIVWHSISNQSLFIKNTMAQAKVTVPSKSSGVKEKEDVEEKDGT